MGTAGSDTTMSSVETTHYGKSKRERQTRLGRKLTNTFCPLKKNKPLPREAKAEGREKGVD